MPYRLPSTESLRYCVEMPEVEEDKVLWEAYLRRLGASEGPFSAERAREVCTLWELLERRFGLPLRPPTAGAMEDDGFAMSWDSGRHHFEIDVAPDGSFRWFYMDRDSDARSGVEDQPLNAISSALISQLRHTLAA